MTEVVDRLPARERDVPSCLTTAAELGSGAGSLDAAEVGVDQRPGH